MIVGLTGGIATGKSTVGQHIEKLGGTVIDADRVARDVVQPGSEALADIAQRFGADVLLPDGSLNRAVLGQIVMNDSVARTALEEITHPRIRTEIATRVRDAFTHGARVVFVEAALLVETGSAKLYPKLWVVRCAQDTQVRRLMERKGCDRATAEQWISSQMDMTEKVQHASLVIDNDGTIQELEDQVGAALLELMAQLPDPG